MTDPDQHFVLDPLPNAEAAASAMLSDAVESAAWHDRMSCPVQRDPL